MTSATQPRTAANDGALTSTGERFIPGLGGQIELEHLHRYLFARQACAGKVVLDIACGEGYGSAMLGQVATRVFGVDIAPEAVAHARKRYSTPNVSFRVGDCAAMPVEDASVDVVVSFETIEHHDRHEEMMREIRRVLRPGGLLILSSPERFEYSERPGTRNEFHVRELYRDEFVDLVGRFFDHVEMYDQKVLFGSAILSEGRATHAASAHADSVHERARGLVRPVYLIAVASNAELPAFDTGVFEQELAKTSEWKWWIETVEGRDTQIRQLDAVAQELRGRLEQQVGQTARTTEVETQLASVTAMLHAVGADRDEKQQRRDESIAQVVELQARLLSSQEALAAQRTALELAHAARERELRAHVAVESSERQLAFEARLRGMQDESAALLGAVRAEAALRDETSRRDFAAEQDRLRAEAVAREAAARQEFEARLAHVQGLHDEAAAQREEADRRHAAERGALTDRLAGEHRTVAHLRQRVADLGATQALEQGAKAEVAAKLDAVTGALDHAGAEMAAARQQGAFDRARIAALEAELEPLHHYAAKLQWVLSVTDHELDKARERSRIDERSLRAGRDAITAMQESTSWRLTAPLRAVKDGAHALARSPRFLRARCGALMRVAYHRLPLATPSKARLKDRLFRWFGFALSGTTLHGDWVRFNARPSAGPDVTRDDGAAIAASLDDVSMEPLLALTGDVPAAVPPDDGSDATEGSFGEPERAATATAAIPQLAEEVTVMTEPPTLDPSYSAAGLPLWVADGTREWADLPLLRDRIAAARAAHLQAVEPQPVEMVSMADRDLHAAARALRFEAHAKPRVTILVPVYNQIALTLECLASIAQARCDTTFEILVADDASTDETSEILATIDHVVVHRNARNLHFLRNCNAALPRANGDFVVFLNNDVQVTDWWLDEMVSAFDRHDRVGAVGPKIVYPSGHLQEAGVAFKTDMTVDMVGLHDDPALPCYNYVRRVDYSSGACLMVATSLLTSLGGFCDDFAPAYCEDGDLCLRIRERGLFVYYVPSATVVHRLSATTGADSIEGKLRLVANNLVTFADKWQSRVEDEAEVRTIAFYLPQYYPFPENDRWWGKGFTEWSNVTKAQPNFVGHYQPHLPADLGYYDLRVARTMDDQADLARRYGLGGFCFYYYWFAGKRLLDLPVERLLDTGKPDFPFCLCWANENWTRRWDGQESHVLMAQSHSDADDEAVIRDLIRYFKRPNYIRIDGRPLLVIYRVTLFPDFAKTAAHWRAICRAEGIGEIYLSMVESFELVSTDLHPSQFGCDATVEFPPQGLAEVVPPSGALLNPDFVGSSVDYRTLAMRYCTRPAPAYTRFRGAMPGWDNTPRRQDNSYCIEHATPGAFQAWLEHLVDDARKQHFGDERIVFINAWNEWAEGAHLEPDRRFGHTYLEAVRNARDRRALLRVRDYAL